tara:strand:+ start:385 stop:1692 length:1308 start_codon:yes stop_codon:yes gene_type:complete
MSFSDLVDTVIRVYNSDNTRIIDNIFLFVIILIFLTILLLNLLDIIQFIISRYNILSEPVNSSSPYNDSLYQKYCNLYETNSLIVDQKILMWFTIYIILFIIFWFNYIVDALSYVRIIKEIKLVGYSKYFNYDLTNKTDYNFLKYLSIYILIVFLILIYYIYNYYNNLNVIDTEVYGNMKEINDEFEKYIIPELYQELIKNDGNSLPKKLSNFIKSDNAIIKYGGGDVNNVNNVNNVMKYFFKEDIDNRLKLMITYIVSEDAAFKTIKIKSLKPSPVEPNANYIPPTEKCFYHMLNNPKKNVILPEYEEITNKNLFIYPPDFASSDFNVDNTKLEHGLPSSEKLKVKYNEIKDRISKYSRNINSYHEDNTIYYKIWLLFITMSGFIASIFALTFFILETGWINITYEEWLKDYLKTLIVLFTLFILIIGAMIINL